MIQIWVPAVVLALIVSSKRKKSVIVDRRKYAHLSTEAASHTRPRKASDVRALVLHQTGFSRGNEVGKYDGVTAHYVLAPDGVVYQLHDHATRLPAAGGLNSQSVSVEIVGNFPARAGSTDPNAFFMPEKYGMHQLTEAQIAGGRALVTELRRDHGITHILAHRQGGPNRENDPGPDAWREIGAWAVKTYKLKWGGEDFSVNRGKPIPPEWWIGRGGGAIA